jgi:hypothetical protein
MKAQMCNVFRFHELKRTNHRLANNLTAHNVALKQGRSSLPDSFTRPVCAQAGDTFHVDYGPLGGSRRGARPDLAHLGRSAGRMVTQLRVENCQ